jgi:hypothetical protein
MADLMATEIRGLAVDYRCFLAQDDDRVLLMLAIADLFLRKGEALLAAGQIDAGYQYVVQGLSVYAQPRTYAFIHYLGAGYTLRRIQALLDRHPPPPAILERLEETAADSLLSRAQLCAGIKVEFLTQAYVPFQDRLAPLRGRVAERWGERTVNAFAEIAGRPTPGDVALWRTINDLYAPLIAGCLDAREPPLAPLEAAARAKLAAVPDSATLKLMAATHAESPVRVRRPPGPVPGVHGRRRAAAAPHRRPAAGRRHRDGPPAGPGDAGAADQRLGRQHGDDRRRPRHAGWDRRHPRAAAPRPAAAGPPVVAPRRRRGVRLLFFQVAALSRFARERLAQPGLLERAPPVGEAAHPLLHRHLRGVAELLRGQREVGERLLHVAGLLGHRLDRRLHAERLRDQIHQLLQRRRREPPRL